MITPVREWSANYFERADRFVALQLEQNSLIVVQSEVIALEPVLDVQPMNAADIPNHANASGFLPLNSGACPVFTLDANLQSQHCIPTTHRICAVMRNAQHEYAVSCVAVSLLARSEINLYPTPRIMLNSRSPILQLMVHDGKLLLGTSSSSLYAHLVVQPEADVISFEQRARRTRQ
jgi:hypothetical protein